METKHNGLKKELEDVRKKLQKNEKEISELQGKLKLLKKLLKHL